MTEQDNDIPCYTLSGAVVDNLRLLVSKWSIEAANETEHGAHAQLVWCPDIIACWRNLGPTMFLVKEPRVDSLRPDCLMWFHGAASFDLIECKWVNEPLLNLNGELTNYCHKAINRLLKNREDLMAGRWKLLQTPPIPAPRAILIGMSATPFGDPIEDSEKLDRALKASKWKTKVEAEELLVTTWNTLSVVTNKRWEREKALNARGIAEDRVQKVQSYLVRQLLSRSFQLQFSRQKRATYDELRKNIEGQAVGVEQFCLGLSEESIRSAALSRLQRLAEMGLLCDQPLDPQGAHALVLMTDLLHYERHGDMPCGRWEHGSTYIVGDMLRDRSDLHEEVCRRLTQIVLCDHNENAVGIATHLARSMPAKCLAPWLVDSAVSQRWTLNSIDPLTATGTHGLVVPHLHVAYTAAIHGNDLAIKFMNECAENPQIVSDIASWNLPHSARNPDKFLRLLLEKAKHPDAKLKPFRAWHTAIYEATQHVLAIA